MADYRDPKVTRTGTTDHRGGMSRWLGILAAAVLVVLILAWWWGGVGYDDAAIEPVAPAPATEGTTGTAPAPATEGTTETAPAAPVQQ